MARMHRADLDIREHKDAQYDIQPEDKLTTLVEDAVDRHVHKAKELSKQLSGLLAILANNRTAIPVLQQYRVISHGDMDHKNVLWDTTGKPLIIDWESARKLNPTHEIVLESLEWSGITGHFEVTLFKRILYAYVEAGGILEPASLEPSFHCVLGDWLNWLMYNLGRNIYMENGDPSALGAAQVDLALTTILRLERLIPSLLPIVNKQTA